MHAEVRVSHQVFASSVPHHTGAAAVLFADAWARAFAGATVVQEARFRPFLAS